MKHGLAGGARPHRPDWTIDQGWERYTAEEHGTWRTLFERQTKLLPGRACDAFVDGMKRLPIGPEAIPDFRRLSEVLYRTTGWTVVAVPGLVPDEVFFEHLANRRFPAGQFIRKPDQLDYLEEPDVFHDVFGHVPMLMNRTLADYIQAYGAGGLRAQKLGVLPYLARVYWYTVEFGLVEQDDGIRIYGSGIASSRTETVFALENASPNRLGFDLEPKYIDYAWARRSQRSAVRPLQLVISAQTAADFVPGRSRGRTRHGSGLAARDRSRERGSTE